MILGWRRIFAICLISALMGCNIDRQLKSRWAMEDPQYALKYSQGAERFDLPSKTKQALDARHLAGHHGYFASGSYQENPSALAGELGLFGYADNWLTVRGSLQATDDSLNTDSFGGINIGLRVQPPSRVAPFVGVGSFNGLSLGEKDLSNDGRDNDLDSLIDESDESRLAPDDWRSTIYPELGLHVWLSHRYRISALASYQITTEGRASDHWLFGVQFAVLAANSEGFDE